MTRPTRPPIPADAPYDAEQVERLLGLGLGWRSAQVYLYIYETVRRHGYVPTVREMVDHFAMGSTNAMTFHLDKLRANGWIDRDRARSRALRILRLPDGRPFRGFIPITAEAE
jgi:repressor LexA